MQLRREDRDLPGLTVLALLTTGPRHTYEMQRFVVETRKDFVTGLPRSMYHAVERLLRDGLIAVHATDRDAGRPERTLYRLTPRGRDALTERVTRLTTTPDRDTTLFVAALSFLACLPSRSAAEQALRTRAEALSTAAERLRGEVAAADVPRLLLVEAEYEITRMEAECTWAGRLADDLASGALPWPDDPARFGFPGGDPATQWAAPPPGRRA